MPRARPSRKSLTVSTMVIVSIRSESSRCVFADAISHECSENIHAIVLCHNKTGAGIPPMLLMHGSLPPMMESERDGVILNGSFA